MTVDRAFLADILERPDDDAPRLIYADWLDDHGRAERAEFIRVQVELARMDRYDVRHLRLVRRESELIHRHGEAWAAETGLEDREGATFRRGFVEHLRFEDCLEFLAQSRRVLARVPLSSIGVEDIGGYDDETDTHAGIVRLGRSKAFRRLRRLELDTIDGVIESDMRALARCPDDTALTELDLSDNDLTDDDVLALADGPLLFRLRVLNLAGNNIGVGGVRRLAVADVGQLRELDLTTNSGPRLYAAGVKALTASANFKALRSLVLGDHHIGGEGLSLLARWPTLAHLDRLDVSYNFGDDAARDAVGLRELITSPYWNLRELNLYGGTVHELPTLEMVLSLENLRTLKVLHLSTFGDPASARRDPDQVARLIAAAPTLDGLHELYMERNDVMDEGRRLLAERFSERLTWVG